MNDYGGSSIGDFGRVTFQQITTIKPPVNPYAPLPLSDTRTVIAKDGRWKGYRVVPRKKLIIGSRSGTTTTYYDDSGYFHSDYKPSIIIAPTPVEIEKEPVVITAPVPAEPVVITAPVVEIEKEKELIEAGVKIDPKWIKMGVVIGTIGLILAILSRRR